MKLSTTFFIFFSIFLQISAESEDFKEINEHLTKLNENLKSATIAYFDAWDRYMNLTLSMYEKFPSMAVFIPEFKAAVEATRTSPSDWPYYDEIKSLNDLKILNASKTLPIDKCSYTDDKLDRKMENFREVSMKMRQEGYEKHKEEFEKFMKENPSYQEDASKIHTLGRVFEQAWRTFCDPFTPVLMKTVNEKIKSYDCPLELSPSNTALEDHEKLMKEFEGSNNSFEILRKLKKDCENGRERRNVEEAFECTSQLPRKRRPEISLKENSCSKLEYDLANEELKLWIMSAESKQAKPKGSKCFEGKIKKFEKEQEQATKNVDKEFYKELIEAIKKIEEENHNHDKAMEEVAEKLPEVNLKMKKIYDENCQCKKK